MEERFGVPGSRFLAGLVPLGFGLVGAALANFPVSLTGGFLPTPLFALMPVYFWGLVRPDLMPSWAAFVIGMTEDLLSGGPPGIWAASFVACYAFVEWQRDALAGAGDYGAILGFAAAMVVAAGTAYGLVALYFWRLPPIAPLGADIAINVLWYIPAVSLMNKVQHHLLGAHRSDL